MRWMIWLLAAACLAPQAAWAEDEVDEVDEELAEDSVVARPGKKIGPAPAGDRVKELTPSEAPESTEGFTLEEMQALRDSPYPLHVHRGVKTLGLDLEFVAACYDGIQKIFSRDYKGANAHWDALAVRYPQNGISHVGRVLVYQSLMLENFDYRFEQQYENHARMAREELEAAQKVPGNDAWESFLLGGVVGIEGIHLMRKGQFVSSLSHGVEAIKHLNKVKELAPDFPDIVLGDGLYKYWRSVVSMNSKLLPDFEDERALGMSEMQFAERNAVFVQPAATLALAFTHIEERRFKQALAACLKNQRAYPDNVINSMVTGRVYLYMRRLDDALRVFQQIEAVSPENQRVHYYYATIYVRKNQLDAASAAIERYLAFELEDPYRAAGLHRKGDIAFRGKDYEAAEALYKEAVRVDNYQPSKTRLDRIKKMKRAGKI